MLSPWSSPETLSNPIGIQRLSNEILDFEKYIQPTDRELRKRKEAIELVRKCVNGIYSTAELQIFGSHLTQLTFPTSDVDCNIQLPEQIGGKVILRAVGKALRRMIRSRRIEIVIGCRVPVIKIELLSGVMVDITAQNPAPSTARTIEWTHEFPELKPLYMVLKQALSYFKTKSKSFQPMQPRHAGLAGFGLICLIVSFLQLNKPADKSTNDPDYYGHLLLSFLDYYATFDASKKVINLTEGGQYFYINNNRYGKLTYNKGKILILNPDNLDENVCRSLLNFDVIQSLFKHCADLLRQGISEHPSRSILSSIIKLQPHEHSVPRNELADFRPETIYVKSIGKLSGKEKSALQRKRSLEEDEPQGDKHTTYNGSQKRSYWKKSSWDEENESGGRKHHRCHRNEYQKKNYGKYRQNYDDFDLYENAKRRKYSTQ